jgi:pimeloyl-ACP methyl ester carboxylesterase
MLTAERFPPHLISTTSHDGTSIGLWTDGRGPSLVVVHGTGGDHTAWDRVVPLLSNEITIAAMDRRGRGASGDGATYALEREVEDVVAAVEVLPAPVYLYGHSFGGTLAAEAALRTRRIRRLALYEGGPKPAGMRFIPDEFIAQLDALVGAGAPEQALETFMSTGAALTADELGALKGTEAWPKRVAAAHTIPRELRALNDYGSDLERFRAIEIPVLLIAGGETVPRRREMLERLSTVLPEAHLSILPGQGHAANTTAPELLAAALHDFLVSAADR